ncbi:hypothetical protein [Komagataeibacter europaeus]|uniref:hypothetical protein n=1 Tax=Komagataeibacter europaeus TaxID=33995 RepID=UPI00128ECA9D|nr:hypothetical protein [Komagataeibacter europaeus]
MINEIRVKSLDAALEIARVTGVMEASDILKNASLIENYLSIGVGVVGTARLPINDQPRTIEPVLDLGTRNSPVFDRNGGEILSGGEREVMGDLQDKTLAGGDVSVTHKASSSAQGGESGKEVTTPSRAETVVTSGDADLQPGTHGKGEDA